MPIKLKIKQLKVGSFLKLRCFVSFNFNGEDINDVVSEEINVNDLAVVRLKFETDDSDSALLASVIGLKHTKANDCQIKMKLSCHDTDDPFYAEWICKDVEQYREIGIKSYCDITFEEVRTCLLNITVSVGTVRDSILEKLYHDVQFTDFRLTSADGSVAIHRAHLAAHSDVFKAMLSREWKETTEGVVTIKGVTLQTLQHLKQYMYLGTLPDEGLLPLLLIASYYLLEDLKEECVSKLAQTMKSGDWCRFFKFATDNNIPELVRAVTLVNPESVLEGPPKMKTQVSE